uniref:Uncharacterized protein n=1 Tax=Cacopsylla melanoneura TaxID=428564 RepID=A0A8D8R176_9HEMI
MMNLEISKVTMPAYIIFLNVTLVLLNKTPTKSGLNIANCLKVGLHTCFLADLSSDISLKFLYFLTFNRQRPYTEFKPNLNKFCSNLDLASARLRVLNSINSAIHLLCLKDMTL